MLPYSPLKLLTTNVPHTQNALFKIVSERGWLILDSSRRSGNYLK